MQRARNTGKHFGSWEESEVTSPVLRQAVHRTLLQANIQAMRDKAMATVPHDKRAATVAAVADETHAAQQREIEGEEEAG